MQSFFIYSFMGFFLFGCQIRTHAYIDRTRKTRAYRYIIIFVFYIEIILVLFSKTCHLKLVFIGLCLQAPKITTQMLIYLIFFSKRKSFVQIDHQMSILTQLLCGMTFSRRSSLTTFQTVIA